MLLSIRNFVFRHLSTILMVSTSIIATSGQASAALIWNWNYSGAGITAGGTFTTVDTPDAMGFYLITGISGSRNGQTITGLQPAHTPIPGNEPFGVDNLVRKGAIQLTGDGFGYSTANGNYASPFFADFLSTPGYLEVFSAPPFVSGSDNLGPEDSELPIVFSASQVPEPASCLLVIAGLGGLMVMRRRSYR